MPENCDFCSIEREDYRIINRNANVTSFLSNPRLTHGHALVIPNRHVILPQDLNDQEVLAMHREAARLTVKMLGSFALGVDRWQKTRPNVAEGAIKRDHVHTHMLPSSPDDPIYDSAIHWGKGGSWAPLGQQETEDLVQLLRAEP